MNISKERFLYLVTIVQNRKEEQKEIREEIKDAITSVAEEFDVDYKVLKNAVNKHIKYLKDPQKFVAEELETDSILDKVIDFKQEESK